MPVGQNPCGLVSGNVQYFGPRGLADCTRPWGWSAKGPSTTFASNMVRWSYSLGLFIFDFLRSEKDIIIAEDDPYYFLQVGEYVPKSKRKAAAADDGDVMGFAQSLIPSFLRLDTQGRVIRMDTFSKVRRGTLTPSLFLWHFSFEFTIALRRRSHQEFGSAGLHVIHSSQSD